MKSRREILRAARTLAAAVSESEEILALQRCEAELGELRGAANFGDLEDPRVVAYVTAKERAERLVNQVTSVFLFPLTGSLRRTQDAAGAGCAGCPR